MDQRAFEDLKESFIRHVVLAFPDRNKPYILYTDASDTGVGAMLCQEDDEKRLRLVVCMSRKLNKHEFNYPVHEKRTPSPRRIDNQVAALLARTPSHRLH